MYAGQVVEYAEVSKIYHNPCHPYTKGLFNSIPKLDTEEDWLEEIHGLPPEPTERIDGCSFNPRCPNCMDDRDYGKSCLPPHTPPPGPHT